MTRQPSKKVLQEGQINVNDNDKLGYTMLHYAASHNHADLIKYLIEKEGADVNCVDPSDWTPLHLAAIADNLKACKFYWIMTPTWNIPIVIIIYQSTSLKTLKLKNYSPMPPKEA